MPQTEVTVSRGNEVSLRVWKHNATVIVWDSHTFEAWLIRHIPKKLRPVGLHIIDDAKEHFTKGW